MATISASVDTFVGPITVTSDSRSIVRLEWSTSPAATADSVLIPAEEAAASDPILAEAVAQLRAYFDGRLGDFDLPVDFGQVSNVARAVLTTLAEKVPAGTTVTYGQLAEASGTGIPARAVGGIMGVLGPVIGALGQFISFIMPAAPVLLGLAGAVFLLNKAFLLHRAVLMTMYVGQRTYAAALLLTTTGVVQQPPSAPP